MTPSSDTHCEYLGRDQYGLHAFRLEERMAMVRDADIIDEMFSRPEMARMYIEAMERAQA